MQENRRRPFRPGHYKPPASPDDSSQAEKPNRDRYDWLTLIVAVIGVVVVAVSSGFAAWNTFLVRDQLHEMIEQRNRSEREAKAVAAREKVLDAQQSRVIAANVDLAEAAEVQASASAEHARVAGSQLAASQAVAILQLRPYLAWAPRMDSRPVAANEFVFLRLINSGNTPAADLKIFVGLGMSVGPAVGDFLPPFEPQKKWSDNIAPKEQMGLAIAINVLSERDLDLVRTGKAHMILRVRADYQYAPGRRTVVDEVFVFGPDEMNTGQPTLLGDYEKLAGE